MFKLGQMQSFFVFVFLVIFTEQNCFSVRVSGGGHQVILFCPPQELELFNSSTITHCPVHF